MSITHMSEERATQIPGAGMVDTKLEVIVIPVADVDRAKRFPSTPLTGVERIADNCGLN